MTAPRERLPLPGARGVWVALATAGLVLPFVLLFGARGGGAESAYASLLFKIRMRNVSSLAAEFAPQPATDDEAARRGPTLPRATTATNPEQDHDRPQIGRPKPSRELDALGGDTAQLETLVIEQLFREARQIAERDAAVGQRALAAVIAHAVALKADAQVGSLVAGLSDPLRAALPEDARAALAATAPATDQPPTTPAALPLDEAHRVASRRSFGPGWGRFGRARVRARIANLAGDLDAARVANAEIHALEDGAVPFLMTLAQLLGLATMVGLGLLFYTLARGAGARAHGEGRLDWLLRRYPGLPASPWPLDPLLPALGMSTWLMGYLVSGVTIALLPGPRLAGGLSVLFQSLFGVIVAVAVIAAFGRAQSPLHSAGLADDREEASGLRATTAALLAYCVLLPLMFATALASAVLWSLVAPEVEPDLHPVQQLLLHGSDPIDLGAMVVAVVLAAPLGEELIFRGFLYRSLRELVGLRGALLISASAFALLHMALPLLLPYLLLGVAFALVYEWTGSLWASVTLHALWNGAVLGLLVVVAQS